MYFKMLTAPESSVKIKIMTLTELYGDLQNDNLQTFFLFPHMACAVSCED
jgi:hypothetical protein